MHKNNDGMLVEEFGAPPRRFVETSEGRDGFGRSGDRRPPRRRRSRRGPPRRCPLRVSRPRQSPVLLRPIQHRHIPPHHAGGRFHPRRPQYRRGQVDVERKVVVEGTDLGRVHARVLNDEGHAYRFLVRVPLIGEAVLGVEVSVVRREYNHRIVQFTLPFQFLQYDAARRIHLRGHAIIILHHMLTLLLRVVSPPPSSTSLVPIGEEVRETLEGFERISGGVGYVRIGVHGEGGVLGKVLTLIPVDGVGGKERHVHEERLIPRPRLEKPQGVRLVLFRNVPRLGPGLTHVPTVVLDAERYGLLVVMIHAPFAHVAHVVSLIPQLGVYRLGPIGEEVSRLGGVVPRCVKARVEGDPRAPADRGRTKNG
mmetsp:Transcript_39635/g.119020  ORF Transcript_39635/g.119020 Transcript_39635/m.119020 type:complete len:367 (+) Transcript_39635:809-1909(+)